MTALNKVISAMDEYLDQADLESPADAVKVVMEYAALLSQRDINPEEIHNLLSSCGEAVLQKHGDTKH
jgi:predicted component of type VI protein secretion system